MGTFGGVFTGYDKLPHIICQSERSEESLFLFFESNPREILRLAQNDKNFDLAFFRGLFRLREMLFARTKIHRLKPIPLKTVLECWGEGTLF
jgi:hypothetical protein